ncbi:isochorismatase family protein [Flavobacterium aquatile]|uniref:Chloroperoxidase n=1 Tax=Flavobacterium aquatile LMG 4008 = ATCC 11947 TaxID=1453498 RepID=A0A095SYS5_9FLAO|nr:isochorismatase family protein [Flavobacterium aquatile]KGD69697.1 chloroperoxidase [Flavobacterium aquatile LMG 4008 = ATCC 11947]OXA67169.1 hydrolase [Flavobacterium aquatile] [Flavobacterium aquatile LMG 4008 = ATCC 11947]GEC77821.1 hydrolase [Flavobacterium aquatile]
MKKLILIIVLALESIVAFAQKPSPSLLTPTNHSLVMVDYQSQMAFATKNISVDQLRTNVALVAGTTKIFNVPTTVTTVAETTFSGPVFPEVLEFYPKATSNYIDRTTMNFWEDVNAHKSVVNKGKKILVIGGLWTSVCIVGPVLSAIDEGYTVYVLTDASGDVSNEAHEMAITRMVQAGARPITSLQYILELQRDWSRSATYKAVTDLIVKYGGAYGVGIQYARTVIKH